jgi:putative transposase
MPRKPIIYTSEFPYHLCTRCNNGNWFSLPKDEIWEIYQRKFDHMSNVYGFLVHGFTLMTNHTHLIASVGENHNLGESMNWLQTSVARETNRKSGQSDHLFGRPYSPSLITDPYYYAHAMRYIYQNPLRAGLSRTVEGYSFSTVHEELNIASSRERSLLKIVSPTNGIDHLLSAMTDVERLVWYNEPLDTQDSIFIKNGLRKRTFKIAKPQGTKKENWLSSGLRKGLKG